LALLIYIVVVTMYIAAPPIAHLIASATVG